MKYQCNQGHIFLFPATYHADKASVFVEAKICPICILNPDIFVNEIFDEFVEPEADITSVKSVPLEDVDAWLTQGYKVWELYAKTTTLVKMDSAPKDAQPTIIFGSGAKTIKAGLEATAQISDATLTMSEAAYKKLEGTQP